MAIPFSILDAAHAMGAERLIHRAWWGRRRPEPLAGSESTFRNGRGGRPRARRSRGVTREGGGLGVLGVCPELWRRLLGRPASESGTLCHGDGAHEGGDRYRRVLMLAILRLDNYSRLE